MEMGVGLMMPSCWRTFTVGRCRSPHQREPAAPSRRVVPKHGVFCPYCGSHLLVFDKCSKCNKNLPPTARFCPKVRPGGGAKANPKKCSQCGSRISLTPNIRNGCGKNWTDLAVQVRFLMQKIFLGYRCCSVGSIPLAERTDSYLLLLPCQALSLDLRTVLLLSPSTESLIRESHIYPLLALQRSCLLRHSFLRFSIESSKI